MAKFDKQGNLVLPSGQRISPQDPSFKEFSARKFSPNEELQISSFITADEVTELNKPPVTTSAEANAGLDDIDSRIDGLPELEQPIDAGAAGKAITEERAKLGQRLKTEEASITAGFTERRARQEEVARGLVSSARAGLASLGILSETPEVTTASQSLQFLTDLSRENARDLAVIDAQEAEALRLARQAKDNKDFSLAQSFIEQADAARKERNAIKIKEFELANEARRIEKEEGREALESFIIQKNEERAEKQFNINLASDAFDALVNANFEGLEELSSREITKLENTLGFVSGTIQAYAKNRAILREIEGWQFSESVNKNTGEVTITMFRPDPDNPGQIESRVTSLGFFGEKFKFTGGGGAGGGVDFKFSKAKTDILIGAGFNTTDIGQIQSDVAEFGIDAVIEGITDPNQLKAINDVFRRDTTEEFDLDTQLKSLGWPNKAIRRFKQDQEDSRSSLDPTKWRADNPKLFEEAGE